MPTPGVAPRGDRHADHRRRAHGCRARAAPDARRRPSRSPDRVRPRPRRGSRRAPPRARRGSTERDRRPDPTPPRLARRDQPDGHPRTGCHRPGARPRQPHGVRGATPRAASTPSSTSGRAAGYPGLPLAVALPAARAALVEPVGKKAAFLGRSSRPPASPRSRCCRSGRRRSRPTQRIAVGGRPSRRGPSQAGGPRRAGLPAARPGRCLVAWKRGDLVAEVAAAQRAIEALGGGAIDSVEPHVTGLEGHRLVVVTSRGRVPPAYPRDPAARKRRPW